MVQIGKLYIIPIVGIMFGQNLGIWPPGVTIYRVTPYCVSINVEEIPSCFVLNVFCGYFVLSNGPNWEVICIIPIFCIIFGQNLAIWRPGVTTYRVTPYCVSINVADIPSCFVLNVFFVLLYITKWSELGSYLHNTNICGNLTYRVDPILDSMGQITKIAPEMGYLPHNISKNELLHETLCWLVENLKFS